MLQSFRAVVVVAVCLFLCGWGQAIKGQQRYLTEDQRIYRNFQSKFLSKDRDVIVALPPGYNNDTKKRYPVLYMHDGNSVFNIWRLDETALALISNQQIEPLIIVHVDNGGTVEDRFDEYTATRDARNKGGKADNYGRMLIEEIKPLRSFNREH